MKDVCPSAAQMRSEKVAEEDAVEGRLAWLSAMALTAACCCPERADEEDAVEGRCATAWLSAMALALASRPVLVSVGRCGAAAAGGMACCPGAASQPGARVEVP